MRWKSMLVAVGVVVGLFALGSAEAALPPVHRIAGSDRFDTAAKVSEAAFLVPGIDVAYVASGTEFPDALAGGAVGALKKGPVLLVDKGVTPTRTAAELDRLDPAQIVVLGGPATVSDAVLNDLKKYSPSVIRISGADRYETSAKISAATFGIGVPVAYIAVGASFPDALAGAAAAGARGGPVLLTEKDSVPASVKAELDRLNPVRIRVLGGTASVSNAVVTQLGEYSADVVRVSGADRYLTAVAVSKDAYPNPDAVPAAFLATGLSFPDALAAGSPAGIAKVPVLLVPAGCIPQKVQDEIDRLKLQAITILGGTSSVSAEIASGRVCSPGNGSDSGPG